MAPRSETAARVKRGPRPTWVRVLIGYFVVVGFLAAATAVAVPFLGLELAGPYPALALPILMLNALVLLATGIVLLNSAKGWWVALAVIGYGILQELAIWVAAFGGRAVQAWMPWWIVAEQASVIRTGIVLWSLYVVLRRDVRAFYGMCDARRPGEPSGWTPVDP